LREGRKKKGAINKVFACKKGIKGTEVEQCMRKGLRDGCWGRNYSNCGRWNAKKAQRPPAKPGTISRSI